MPGATSLARSSEDTLIFRSIPQLIRHSLTLPWTREGGAPEGREVQASAMKDIEGKLTGDSGWAVPQEALLSCTRAGVSIRSESNDPLEAAWDAVTLRQSIYDESYAVLEAHTPDGRAWAFEAPRKSLFDAVRASSAPIALLAQAATIEYKRATTGRGKWRQLRVVLVIFVVLGAMFWVGLQYFPTFIAERFPLSWEERLGQATLSQVGSEGKLLTGGAPVDVVNKVWERLQTGLEPSPYAFRLYVVDAPIINAFAMPGGYVVIYTGLLKALDTPESLAGILGHEAQHVIHKHSLKSMVRSAQWRVGLGLLITMLLGRHEVVQVIQRMAATMDTLAYSRGHESEADQESIKALVRAGIDPVPFTNFFHTLAKKEGHRPALLSTHPPSDDRAEVLQAEVRTLEPFETRPIDVDWKDMQRMLGSPRSP